MSTATIDYDALAAQHGAITSNPAPSSAAPSQPTMAANIDYDALAAKHGAVDQSAVGTGQTTNDTGSTVIVPKEEESFADTMKRAAAFGQTAQAKAEAAKESTPQNLGTKAAETLAAAPAIGAVGAAGLAGAGEAGAAAGEATLRALPSVTKLVQAAGELAKEHPLVAKGIYDLIRGSLLVKIVRSWPE